MMERQILPEKMYYSIGEIARHFGVSTSLIRYWEDEFPHITPRKNGKGDRRYNKNDIEKIARIYELIKERGFTIRGAQAFLADKDNKDKTIKIPEKEPETNDSAMTTKDSLIRLRNWLVELKSELEQF
jgi:DNA-binding transcriptional MerR regulator